MAATTPILMIRQPGPASRSLRIQRFGATRWAAVTLLFLSASVYSQTAFYDGFGDGEFTKNPAWTGQTSRYSVETDPVDSANLVLRGSGTGTAHKHVNSVLNDEVPWDRFFVSFDLLSTVKTSGQHGKIFVRFGNATGNGSFTYNQRVDTGIF